MSDTHTAQPDPLMIGGVPKAAFARLPEPASLFARRAARARFLSASGELAPYLTFLAGVADAQAAILADAPEPFLPAPDLLDRARQFAMPPLDRTAVAPDVALREICRRLFDQLAPIEKPVAAETALERIRGADDAALDGVIAAVLADAPRPRRRPNMSMQRPPSRSGSRGRPPASTRRPWSRFRRASAPSAAAPRSAP